MMKTLAIVVSLVFAHQTFAAEVVAKSGDTLAKIASGTIFTAEQLQKLNGLADRRLRAGQKLYHFTKQDLVDARLWCLFAPDNSTQLYAPTCVAIEDIATSSPSDLSWGSASAVDIYAKAWRNYLGKKSSSLGKILASSH